MNVLHLTLKKKWFDLIASGKKKVEYREIKPYWIRRLTISKSVVPEFRDARMKFIRFDEIHLRNGYRKDSPFMRVGHRRTRIGVPFSDPPFVGIPVFLIHLGKVIEVRRYSLNQVKGVIER